MLKQGVSAACSHMAIFSRVHDVSHARLDTRLPYHVMAMSRAPNFSNFATCMLGSVIGTF